MNSASQAEPSHTVAKSECSKHPEIVSCFDTSKQMKLHTTTHILNAQYPPCISKLNKALQDEISPVITTIWLTIHHFAHSIAVTLKYMISLICHTSKPPNLRNPFSIYPILIDVPALKIQHTSRKMAENVRDETYEREGLAAKMAELHVRGKDISVAMATNLGQL